MKCRIEKGRISFDAEDFVSSLDDESKKEIARCLISDQDLFEAVAEAAASGVHFGDEEARLHDSGPGWWSIGDTARLREKLIPLMPEITRELVRQTIRDRKRAELESERVRKAIREIYEKWPITVGYPDVSEYLSPSSAEIQAEVDMLLAASEAAK